MVSDSWRRSGLQSVESVILGLLANNWRPSNTNGEKQRKGKEEFQKRKKKGGGEGRRRKIWTYRSVKWEIFQPFMNACHIFFFGLLSSLESLSSRIVSMFKPCGNADLFPIGNHGVLVVVSTQKGIVRTFLGRGEADYALLKKGKYECLPALPDETTSMCVSSCRFKKKRRLNRIDLFSVPKPFQRSENLNSASS